MKIRMRNFIYFLLALIMMVQPVLTTGMTVSAQESTDVRQVKIAIISDIHYVVDEIRSKNGEEALQYSALTESRMEQEIDTILDVALEQTAKENPDVLLACGDLLSNGEYVGAEALAEKLKSAKEMKGMQNTGIYVVNGNHDINNSYSVDFSKDEYWNAQRVQPEDFKTIYDGLGYGANDSYNKSPSLRSVYTPPAGELAGGLSYVTEIAEGITLIVLDTGKYSNNTAEHYSLAQETSGRISDGLLTWAVEQAEIAKAKGNLVLAMSHHAMIPHDGAGADRHNVDWYMSSFVIDNSTEAANALADAGVTAILTGHTHASDIAEYTSPNGNKIYDIETAALCAYPTAFRMLTIRINQTGDKKTYSFSIDTKFLDKDFAGKNTSNWKIVAGENKGKDFAYYGGSMQAYGKEKSIYHPETIRAMIDYMLRSTLYPMVKEPESLENYLCKSLDPTAASLEDAIAKLLKTLPLDQPIDLTFEFEMLGSKSQISIKSINNGTAAKAGEDEQQPLKLGISTTFLSLGDLGEVTINLKLLPAYAAKLVRQIDEELKKPDWQTNNYGTQNVLLNDVINALNDAVLPSLTVPLDASDPDSTALNIWNDAAMAWAHGDEGLASAEDQDRRQNGNKLLQSDGLVSILKENAIKALLTLNNTSKYPGFAKILKTPFNETEDVISLSTGMQVVMGFLVPGFYYGNFSLSDLMQVLAWAGPDVLAARLPESMNTFLKDNLLAKVAGLQLAYATDTNIPNDSKYSFSITEDDPIPEPASEKYVWVRVEWDDDSDKDGIRPEFVKVNLLKGEEVIGEPFILNEGNNWFGTFTGLDPVIKYDVKVEMRDFINGNKETGYEISYQRVREDPLGDYYQIILTHTPNKSVEPGPRHIDFYRIGDLSWLYDRQLPGTGFSASRVTELRERPQGMVYGTTGLTLQIPELDVSEAIMTVPEVDGEYPVEWLGSAIGLLEQSSLPGKGVSVLAGHNHLNSTEAGPFLSLGSLESGDRVMVTDARNGMQMYRVYGNYKIASNAFASVAENVRDSALVLITCEDESADGGYLNRRVILAEPVGK
ncbi:MAG: metallophosphoesterase [Anaerolineaceae bacterium]|nr:metallophosphoesterase [Anaerolineaceae bacterium]